MGKKPWEMTWDEWLVWAQSTHQPEVTVSTHRRLVEMALATGQSVPMPVLADYPQIARRILP